MPGYFARPGFHENVGDRKVTQTTMASAFSHAFVALALGKCFSRTKLKILVTGMICAALPDIDAIGFWIGVPYDSIWGHRGITHSLFFALILAAAVMIWMFPRIQSGNKAWWMQFMYLFLATASHPLLDAMTNGGLGVAFFAPFENSRYFFPFRPIRVSPISVSRFFSDYGWQVFKSELVWIWIPSVLVMALAVIGRSGKKSI